MSAKTALWDATEATFTYLARELGLTPRSNAFVGTELQRHGSHVMLWALRSPADIQAQLLARPTGDNLEPWLATGILQYQHVEQSEAYAFAGKIMALGHPCREGDPGAGVAPNVRSWRLLSLPDPFEKVVEVDDGGEVVNVVWQVVASYEVVFNNAQA